MQNKIIQINRDRDAIVSRVRTDKGYIVNYYNPCEKLSLDILNNVGGLVQDSVIWCGEFNSHNTLWGSNSTDANGVVVEQF